MLLLVLAVAALAADAVPPGRLRPPELGAGVYLVAAPGLQDPNFARSVVLLLAYDPTGALGLVVNRPPTETLAEAVPDWPDRRTASWAKRVSVQPGGPVQPGRVHLLIHAPVPPEPRDHAAEIMPGTYVTASKAVVAWASQQQLTPHQARAFSGYAGWGPGQLDREVFQRGWFLAKAGAAAVFDHPAESLWRDLLQRARALWVWSGTPEPKVSRSAADETVGSNAAAILWSNPYASLQ